MHTKAIEKLTPEAVAAAEAAEAAEAKTTTKKKTPIKRVGTQFRETNWDIGRTAERVGTADSVTPYVPGDRWKAWRKRVAKKKRWMARQALLSGTKGGKKRRPTPRLR
jgi:Ni/Co efflux regulator RcnB